jgi:hypothetical protein
MGVVRGVVLGNVLVMGWIQWMSLMSFRIEG